MMAYLIVLRTEPGLFESCFEADDDVAIDFREGNFYPKKDLSIDFTKLFDPNSPLNLDNNEETDEDDGLANEEDELIAEIQNNRQTKKTAAISLKCSCSQFCILLENVLVMHAFFHLVLSGKSKSGSSPFRELQLHAGHIPECATWWTLG